MTSFHPAIGWSADCVGASICVTDSQLPIHTELLIVVHEWSRKSQCKWSRSKSSCGSCSAGLKILWLVSFFDALGDLQC